MGLEEFTRLDEIVDIVFSTAEQAAQPESESVAEAPGGTADEVEKRMRQRPGLRYIRIRKTFSNCRRNRI